MWSHRKCDMTPTMTNSDLLRNAAPAGRRARHVRPPPLLTLGVRLANSLANRRWPAGGVLWVFTGPLWRQPALLRACRIAEGLGGPSAAAEAATSAVGAAACTKPPARRDSQMTKHAIRAREFYGFDRHVESTGSHRSPLVSESKVSRIARSGLNHSVKLRA